LRRYGLKFANAGYTKDSEDGELYGDAGPTSAGAAPGSAAGAESYADIDGAVCNENYEEIGPGQASSKPPPMLPNVA